MRIFERIRCQAYWLLDIVKGAPIRTQLREIEFIFNNWHNKGSHIIDQYLQSILAFSVDNIPYYQRLKKSGYDLKSISDFPVVNKNIIRDNEELFLNSKLSKDSLFRQATSGSTGMPFVVYQDIIKRQRATADTLFFSKLANYELGTRLYFSRVWEQGTERSRLTCLMQNWRIHDSSNLSDNSIKLFIDALEKDNSTKSVLIFASTLASIAKYIEENDIYPKTKVSSFITVSESLDPITKKIIQQRYHAPVVSRYSDQELGIMAQQCFDSDEFHINIASFYFELLDLNEDKPVEYGHPGRVVVTDLFNHAMPLIRYDTGDIAVMKKCVDCDIKVPCFQRIEGRRVDFILDTSGNKVSPYAINSPMHVYLEIQQYQFIQYGPKQYTMLLNLKSPNAVFEQEDDMISMLKSYLGKDADISVEYVNEIPVLKSGKRKQVVNKYKSV